MTHIRLIIGKTLKIKTVNLCDYDSEVIRLPKKSQLTDITCEDCLKRWKEERD